MESIKAEIGFRRVPELRIKLLESEHHYPAMVPQERAIEMFFDTMGREIALKLMEFHKYKIVRNNHYEQVVITSHIEVIVPTSAEIEEREIHAKPI